MNFVLLAATYNTYGFHSISLVGDFLSIDAPEFGKSLLEVEILACFRSQKGPKKNLGYPYEKHHARCAELPVARFLRKKQRFCIDYVSKAASGEDISKHRACSAELFRAMFHEIHQQMMSIEGKLRKSDDFNFIRFSNWLSEKEKALPMSEPAVAQLAASAEAWNAARRNAMNDWEKLGLDWIDFHPKARQVLDNPFFWDGTNEFAPNGNDTGADVLALFREWRRRNVRTSSEAFLDELLRGWKVNPEGSDDFSVETYDESAIGLAFTHLKLDAACPNWLVEKALSSIQRQRNRAREHPEWKFLDERLRTIEVIERKLRNCPRLQE